MALTALARLADGLRELGNWDERFDALERFLRARLAAGPVADPAVAWAWRRLQQTAGRVRIETLATELGASRRYLARRFAEHIGLSPKRVARLLRFAGVRRRIECEPSDWAQIAFEAGYADQSHLNREFRQFAGTTPTDLRGAADPRGRGGRRWLRPVGIGPMAGRSHLSKTVVGFPSSVSGRVDHCP